MKNSDFKLPRNLAVVQEAILNASGVMNTPIVQKKLGSEFLSEVTDGLHAASRYVDELVREEEKRQWETSQAERPEPISETDFQKALYLLYHYVYPGVYDNRPSEDFINDQSRKIVDRFWEQGVISPESFK